MVEVFKTTVKEEANSRLLLKELEQEFSHAIINFDLEDCDNILRIESCRKINVHKVNLIMKQFGHHSEILK